MRRIAIACLFASLALGVQAARADKAVNPDPRAAFAETDKNQDGVIDREEFYQRVVEIFFFGDHDKDGYLSPQELAATVEFPDDFKNADLDHDGRISLVEFMNVRFKTFDEVDTNHDGELSLDEVLKAWEGKQK